MVLSLLTHVIETIYIAKYKLSSALRPFKNQIDELERQNLRICYDFLKKTSRSFSVVIQNLGPELRDAVCLFYLILRGLDTIGEC
jgi:farnesyl-diphosphate farnesyltransferase